MIQLACVMFLLHWVFWTWSASSGASLVEDALFAFPIAIISAVFTLFLVFVVTGALEG